MTSYEQEVFLIAGRYAELLEIANDSLECYRIFKNTDSSNTASYRKFNKLEGKQHLIICITFAISAVEAFVNHLGYIFDDAWEEYEAKNFFIQYRKVIGVLKSQNISDNDFLTQCYPNFECHRESMRNPIQHPHASKHDSAYSKECIVDPNDIESFNNTASDFLNLWGNIGYDDAEKAVCGVKSFISSICAEIIKSLPISLNNQEKENLLDRLIEFPFSAIPLVSGATSLFSDEK